jgi:hypothetical protein
MVQHPSDWHNNQKHEAWGHPVVIEGYALRPSYVRSLTGDVSGVFLLAEEALIEKRVGYQLAGNHTLRVQFL